MSDIADTASVEADAARWIAERCDRESWDATKQSQLDAWLANSTTHEVAYFRLLALWNSADRLAVLSAPLRPPALQRSAKRRWPMLRAAAFIVLAVGSAAMAYFYAGTPSERTYSTPLGGHETIMLADGSKIELNTNTILRTQLTPAQRSVTLVQGEAFFDIRHNQKRPFTVDSGGHRITDVGTKFIVRSDPGRVEVSLIEGRARFDYSDKESATPPTMLSPGDVAVATTSALSLTRKSQNTLEAEASWRRGVLVFDHTSLADAATEINRYSSKKLVVADPQAARLTIGGTFPTGNVRTIAEAAQDFYGLKFKDRGDEIVISH